MKSLSKVCLVLLGILAASSLSTVEAVQDSAQAGTSIVEAFKNKKLGIAYADNCTTSAEDAKDPEKVRKEQVYLVAKGGVNVMIWAFINQLKGIESDGGKKVTPFIDFSLEKQLPCIAAVKKQLEEDKIETMHLISIGGWAGPHPDTRISSSEWYSFVNKWNYDLSEKYLNRKGERFFAGIDWDMEGNDDLPQYNTFSVPVLNLMGEMSQMAKRDGYFMSLVPSQSLFDVQTHNFSRSASTLSPVDPWHQEFNHLGLNAYMYLPAKFGQTEITTTNSLSQVEKKSVKTFDIISIQLYDAYSRAGYQMEVQGESFPNYLADHIRQIQNFDSEPVHFAQDKELGFADTKVSLDIADQLVEGFGFGVIAPIGRTPYVSPEQMKEGWDYLAQQGLPTPRGAMFWAAAYNNIAKVNGTNHTADLAGGFDSFLHTRTPAPQTTDAHDADNVWLNQDKNKVDVYEYKQKLTKQGKNQTPVKTLASTSEAPVSKPKLQEPKQVQGQQKLSQGVPVLVTPVLMTDTMGAADLEMKTLVGPDEFVLNKKKAQEMKSTQVLSQHKGVPVLVNPVLMTDTMGAADLEMKTLVGPDEFVLEKKKKVVTL